MKVILIILSVLLAGLKSYSQQDDEDTLSFEGNSKNAAELKDANIESLEINENRLKQWNSTLMIGGSKIGTLRNTDNLITLSINFSHITNFEDYKSRDLDFMSIGSSYNNILFHESNLSAFSSSGDSLGKIKFQSCRSLPSFFSISSNKDAFDLVFENSILPDTLVLESCKTGTVNLSGICYAQKNNKNRIPLFVIQVNSETNPELLKLSFSKYELAFSQETTLEERIKFLKEFLLIQKQKGLESDIQKAQILLNEQEIERGNFSLSFQKYLWNYGYSKSRLILWACFAFLVFYLINLKLFRRLLFEVYEVSAIKDRYIEMQSREDNLKNKFRHYLLVLLYSSLIFFGIKMDASHFQYKHLMLTLYLWVFYLVGLLLVFYLIGLILVR